MTDEEHGDKERMSTINEREENEVESKVEKIRDEEESAREKVEHNEEKDDDHIDIKPNSEKSDPIQRESDTQNNLDEEKEEEKNGTISLSITQYISAFNRILNFSSVFSYSH